MNFVKTGELHQELIKGGVKETETDIRSEDALAVERVKQNLPEFTKKHVPSHVLNDERPPEGNITDGDQEVTAPDFIPASMTEEDIEFLRKHEREVSAREAKKEQQLEDELEAFRDSKRKVGDGLYRLGSTDNVQKKEDLGDKKVSKQRNKDTNQRIESLFGRKGALGKLTSEQQNPLGKLKRNTEKSLKLNVIKSDDIYIDTQNISARYEESDDASDNC